MAQNIKTFSYNDKTQLTKNINVKELRCKDNKGHSTLVDLVHIQNVQKFMDTYGYDKVVITSGYRCASHDKKVGGSGKGQHTKGTAVDVSFRKNGKVVNHQLVSCQAQDFGFKGIGYISSNTIHLDNRASGTYRGDERKGRSNNVKDFYTYFKISKSEPTPTPSPTPTKKGYTGTYPTIPKRGYFKNGDKGEQVKYLQKLLNWINDSKLSVDGVIGPKTIAGVKIAQKRIGTTQDGKWGANSNKKAKNYKK